MYISVMIDLCTLSGVLFWPLFCVHFWVLSDKSTFLSTSLITFLSSLGREHFFECFFEHSFEHFFEYSRARVLFWALSWALFWVLSGESAFLSTFLITQKTTLGISGPTSCNWGASHQQEKTVRPDHAFFSSGPGPRNTICMIFHIMIFKIVTSNLFKIPCMK